MADIDAISADAPREDFRLQDLMNMDQVVERYPTFHRRELLAAMRARTLRHWAKGRARYVTERWLQDWIRSQLHGGDGETRQRVSGSDTGDRQECDGPSAHKMTPEQEEFAAKLLVESMTRKPRRPVRPAR